MREPASRLFGVGCRGCHEDLLTVDLLRDRDIEVVTTHLRTCAASEPLPSAPRLGHIMARLIVRRQAVDVGPHPDAVRTLRALVFNRLFFRYHLDDVKRFATWLNNRNPAQAHDTLVRVECALRDPSSRSTGQRRYVLTGFGLDGEPVIAVHSVR